MSVFKACDIRGLAGKELTVRLFRRMGRGIAVMMGERRSIVVGGDVRQSTHPLKVALIEGLRDFGRDVTDVGTVPTPVVYFARWHRGAHACAMVTASHNPPEYNGLKFMIGDIPVMPEDLARLERLVQSDATRAPTEPRGGLTAEDLTGAYEAWLADALEALRPPDERAQRHVRIVVDAGNGCFSELAPRALRRVPGVSVEPLFCEIDGGFPGRDPNCAIAENLTALRDRVRRLDADLGVAFDGDGDRVAFTDETGAVVPSEDAALLFLRFLRGRVAGRAFVYDLKCSRVVAREAGRLGARPVEERSGHAFIKRRMIRERAAFGAEISGHYFYDVLHGGDDGLFSALLMVQLLRGSREPLSALRAALPARYVTPDVRIRWPADQVHALLAAVRSAFPPWRVREIDGVRVEFEDGWALLRPSITEPKVTLRFEGDSAAALGEIVERFLTRVPQLRAPVRDRLASTGLRG